MRALIRRIEALENQATDRTHRRREVAIIDGGDVPWCERQTEPRDGALPDTIVVIGVLPKEVRREH